MIPPLPRVTLLCSPLPHCFRLHLFGVSDGMSQLSLGYKRLCDFCLGLWICPLGHLLRQAAMLPAALWRGLYGEQVLSSANSQGWSEACQEPWEWTWKQTFLSQLGLLEMTATLANSLITTSWVKLNKNHSVQPLLDSWPSKTRS